MKELLKNKKVLAAVVAVVCLLAGIDLAVLEDSNIKGMLDKVQQVVGDVADEVPTEAPVAPVTSDTTGE